VAELSDPWETEVMTGYKQPPRSTQFEKGRSGNLKGRPKGSGNFKIDLLQVMGRNVFITENGQRRAVSGRKAVAIKLLHDALHGDAKALASLTAHLLKHDVDGDTRPEAEFVTENDRTIIEDFLRRNSIPSAKDEKP
jgi:hypothetical protein